MATKRSIGAEEEEFTWNETSLETFKNYISDQGIKCCMDDIFLLGFLRARKYDLPASFEFLKNYYNCRVNYPQFFKDLLPSNLEHALSMNCIQFLPKPDQKGRYIFIWQLKDWNTSVCNITDIYRAALLYTDLQLNFHQTQVKGIVVIFNAEGLSLSHFLQYSPTVLNSIVSIFLRDSYQLRIKEIHYLNINVILKAILSVFIPLLPNALKNRIHIHSDVSTLNEFFIPECLPLEYGGKLPSFDPTDANNMIRANEEFFRKNEEYLNLYREEINKDVSENEYCEEDKKRKKFIEKCEEKYKHYSQKPEEFLASLEQDPEFHIRNF